MAKKPCEYCEDELYQITADNTDKLIMELYPGKVIACFGYFEDANGETVEATNVNNGGCGASTGWYQTVEKAITAWNRRNGKQE